MKVVSIGETMKKQFIKAEWLITRKCQLRCDYCNIRNPQRKIMELSLNDKINVLNKLKYLGVGIVVFYGGEPTTLKNEMITLIKHCHDIDLKYAFISHGLVDLMYIRKLIENGLRNWSVSLDTLYNPQGDTDWKSRAALATLEFTKGMVKDRCACITVTAKNLREIPSIIHYLSNNDVWSILSLYNVKKEGFQYSAYSESLMLTEKYKDILDMLCLTLKDMKNSGDYLMHDPIEMFDFWRTYGITQNWKCSMPVKLAIDADGTLLTCTDWHDLKKHDFNSDTLVDERTWNVLDLDESNIDLYKEAWKQSASRCPGCCWSAAYLLENFASLQGIEKGIELITHSEE